MGMQKLRPDAPPVMGDGPWIDPKDTDAQAEPGSPYPPDDPPPESPPHDEQGESG
jgi:hypothetical protein